VLDPIGINEEQAAVIRSIFEMYASGQFTLNAIARSLEKRSVATLRGKGLWYTGNIKKMLHNSTYAGTRYFNRSTNVSEASGDGKRPTPKRVVRDREDWIAVQVPAIVSRELFDKVQELLRIASERYRLPSVPHLLGGLVRCAECGRSYTSARRYVTNLLPSAKVSVYHRALYRCNRHLNDNGHDSSRTTRCRNSTVATHILDNKVVDLIQEVMFDPQKLGLCIESSDRVVDPTSARELARIAREIKHLDDERRRVIERYATERMVAEDYVNRNLALDKALNRLKREKAEVAGALRDAGAEDFLGASIRHFCATARARFEECADFEAKRQFLRGHIERIFFDHGKVMIVGNVAVPSPATKDKTLQFRIEGEIDRATARSKSSRGLWRDERSTSWVPGAAPTYFPGASPHQTPATGAAVSLAPGRSTPAARRAA
jgi:hypothetical protein